MIENTIRACVEAFPRGSGDDLSGFRVDCDCSLYDRDIFRFVHTETMDEPLSQIIALVQTRADVPSLQHIAHVLADVWREIAYREFGAVSITLHAEAVLMRFATACLQDPLAVTGTIIVKSPQQEKLVKRYNRTEKRSGALAPLPQDLPLLIRRCIEECITTRAGLEFKAPARRTRKAA